MRLAVVGSQALSRRQGEHVWVLAEGLMRAWEPQIVVSGGATGVDSVAAQVALSLGYCLTDCRGAETIDDFLSVAERRQARWFFSILPEVSAWEPIGKKGFKARNIEIVNSVDRLVRISKHQGQRTYGSGWTADYADETLGEQNVYRYYV